MKTESVCEFSHRLGVVAPDKSAGDDGGAEEHDASQQFRIRCGIANERAQKSESCASSAQREV